MKVGLSREEDMEEGMKVGQGKTHQSLVLLSRQRIDKSSSVFNCIPLKSYKAYKNNINYISNIQSVDVINKYSLIKHVTNSYVT